jgi:NADH:ubiquinone oxidoreductase subunit 5 (subunit L)/multisubunit Na+/H+ antiporter MnhA subunit
MTSLGITPADLEANRQGRLSENQKARLREKLDSGARSGLIVGAVVMLIFIVGAIYMIFFNPETKASFRQLLGDNPLMLVIPIVLVVVFYALMFVFSMAKTNRMKSGNVPVKSVEGKVKLSVTQMVGLGAAALASAAGASTRAYIVRVGRMTMYTDEATFTAFENGRAYRIFYVPNKPTHFIVSAEALEAARR